MEPSDLRVALFSGNYNYVRDGANQALNKLVGHLLDRGVTVRVYSPTTDTPAFPPTGELVSVPGVPLPGGRDEFKLARGFPASIRRDVEAFAPNIIHLSAPDILGHRALTWARKRGLPTFISMHTRFETYPPYYHIGFVVPLVIKLATRFYNRAEQIVVPRAVVGRIVAQLGRDDADQYLVAWGRSRSVQSAGAQPRVAPFAGDRRRRRRDRLSRPSGARKGTRHLRRGDRGTKSAWRPPPCDGDRRRPRRAPGSPARCRTPYSPVF